MSFAFSIGKSKRPDLNNSVMAKFVPGPGNYRAKTTYTATAEPRWGFGSSKRPKLNAPESTKGLGPGAYNIPQRAVEGSRYSMGAITVKNKYGSLAPGPGTYQPDLAKTQNFKYSMAAKLEKGGIIEPS